jgi:Mce-associated membrane protein
VRALSEPAAAAATNGVIADDDVTDEPAEAPGAPEHVTHGGQQMEVATNRRRPRGILRRGRVLAYAALPVLALIMALGAGYLKWEDASVRADHAAAIEATGAARASTIALLSYHPETVDKELVAARDRLSGAFRDSYTSLTNDVVIPGAKQKHISAVVAVPAAAAVSATSSHAVVLVFVDQTTTIGDEPPTDTTSSVKVTLDKVGARWLITDFRPV